MDLVEFLRARLDEDERIARAASGNTVLGEPGNWRKAPGGDEWSPNRDDGYADELLVALRPGLPRPPDVASGCWGVVVGHRWESGDPGASPFSEFEHAARHDPARVLREIDAKRLVLRDLEQVEFALSAAGPGTPPHDLMTGAVNLLRRTARLLALPHADHPDYRDEWRPEA